MPEYECANIFPFIINGPLWLSQVLLVVYGAHISNSTRMIPGFTTSALAMLLIPLIANIGDATGFYSTIVILLIFGFASGAAQGTTFQMAAAFPPNYMGAVMLGNGISGIGANILRAITLMLFPASDAADNEFRGALTMFLIAFFI